MVEGKIIFTPAIPKEPDLLRFWGGYFPFPQG
jgi:hypothetical protein